MKIVFFCTYYPQYLDFVYKKNKHLRTLPYENQMNFILSDYSSVWGSYTKQLRKLGAEVELIIPNCKPLQAAWAKENGHNFPPDWYFSVPKKQVKKIQPDVFFIGSMFEYYGSFLDEIKQIVPNVFGWISCPIPANIDISKLGLIVTSLPKYVDQFRSMGINSELLTSAFDTEILNKLEPIAPDIDFSFLGSFTNAHQNRIKMIKTLVDNTPVQIFGTGLETVPDERPFLERLFKKSPIQERYKGEKWGLDMFRVLRRSKITFNVHIDISGTYAGNMRMFEATGVGTLLVTDGTHSPARLFADDEVIYYKDINDAIEQVNYYLKHEDERKSMAKRGQSRTFSNYNIDITSAKMYEYLKSHSH